MKMGLILSLPNVEYLALQMRAPDSVCEQIGQNGNMVGAGATAGYDYEKDWGLKIALGVGAGGYVTIQKHEE